MADSETPEKYLCSPEGLLRQVLSFPNVSSRIQLCSYEEFLVFRPVGVSTLLTVIDTHENGLVSLFLLRCYNQSMRWEREQTNIVSFSARYTMFQRRGQYKWLVETQAKDMMWWEICTIYNPRRWGQKVVVTNRLFMMHCATDGTKANTRELYAAAEWGNCKIVYIFQN